MCREPGRKESKNEFFKKFALRVLKKEGMKGGTLTNTHNVVAPVRH